MTPGPDPARRCDVAVVLARGESRRFGEPKALAVLADDPRPLVRRVVDLYAGPGWTRIIVVANESLGGGVTALLREVERVTVVMAPGGGDTARTLAEAWDALGTATPGWTHAWVHPVDVPVVAAGTLAVLHETTVRNPDRQVRPTWRGAPGHPVIVPAPLLGALLADAQASTGPWRDVMCAGVAGGRVEAGIEVPVADPGVASDHDTRPAQAAGGQSTEER